MPGPTWSTDAITARALEAVATPAAVFDREDMVFANSAMQRLVGRTTAQFVTTPPGLWLADSCRDSFIASVANCLATASDQAALELEAITSAGSTRPLEAIVRPLELPDGRYAIVTFQDLSDIRHVQSSLLRVASVMQQVIETIPIPMFALDAGHRVTHWNRACAQLSGAAAAQVLGTTDAGRMLGAGEEGTLADQIIDRAAAGEDTDTLQGERQVTLHGEGRWLMTRAAPLRDPEGQLIGAIGTLQDVTARRLAEDVLRRHRNDLERLVAERTAELVLTHQDLNTFLENAPVGIIQTDGKRIARGNRTFSAMFGLAPEEVTALDPCTLFVDPADHMALVQATLEPFGSASDARPSAVRMVTGGGTVLWVQIITCAAAPGQATPHAWWLLQDRTDVVKAQEDLARNFADLQSAHRDLEEAQGQLLQSEKMASIGQLAAGVAHEINNPVGFVSSNLSSLRRQVESLLGLATAYIETESPSQASSPQICALKAAAEIDFLVEDLPLLIKESEEGLSRVRKIVQDLKDFSRVDHSEWQYADLNAGLESTLNVVMNEVKYKAEVRREYGKLPQVRCLAGQLNQVFMNLIVNAAQSIEGRGVVTLRSGCEGEWVWVEVADTGCGMTPEVQRRIFEPFFTTKPVGRGTGLGLSVSFSIVKKHGGHIKVTSAPGEGTSFRVYIPNGDAAAASPAGAAGPVEALTVL